jgi:hypothetical protein
MLISPAMLRTYTISHVMPKKQRKKGLLTLPFSGPPSFGGGSVDSQSTISRPIPRPANSRHFNQNDRSLLTSPSCGTEQSRITDLSHMFSLGAHSARPTR